MFRVVESSFVKSAVKPKDYPDTQFQEVAFAGKSNVGKSSLINTLLNRKLLAKISGKPGKTRLLNFFEIRGKKKMESSGEELDAFFQIVDLPGYGYAKVSKSERESWKKMIMTFLTQRIQLRLVVLLVDIRHKADPKDRLMMEMLQEAGIKFILVATKSDKIKGSKALAAAKKLKAEFGVDVPIFPVSSLKKKGMDKLLNTIEDILF